MKISVVIPSFNCASSIVSAIESVVRQTHQPLEILIVDDGSTDETPDLLQPIIKKHDNIRYFYQSNQGQGAARNYGVSKAKGDWIAFLDADDGWDPEKLEIQTKLLLDHPEVDLWFTNAHIIKDGINRGNHFPTFCSYPPSNGNLYSQLLKTNFIINSSVLIKRSIFETIGGFDESDLLRRVEDYDLWLRVAKNHTISGTDRPLVIYNYPRGENRAIATIAKGLKAIYKKQLLLSPIKDKLSVLRLLNQIKL